MKNPEENDVKKHQTNMNLVKLQDHPKFKEKISEINGPATQSSAPNPKSRQYKILENMYGVQDRAKEEKILRLKDAITNGDYSVSGELIAQKMIPSGVFDDILQS